MQVFEQNSIRCIDERKKGGGVGTYFRNEAENEFMLVNMISACNQLLFFLFCSAVRIRNKMPVQIRTSTLELNQAQVTALAHHKPQVCAVGDRLILESKVSQLKETRDLTRQ